MAQGACLSPPAFVRFREETFKMTIAADAAKTDRPVSSRDFSPSGFDTMCLHAGYDPHGDETTYGLGQGAPRGVPLHRTAPYQVRSASSPRAQQRDSRLRNFGSSEPPLFPALRSDRGPPLHRRRDFGYSSRTPSTPLTSSR